MYLLLLLRRLQSALNRLRSKTMPRGGDTHTQGREEVIRYKWNISAGCMGTGFVAERMRRLRRGKLRKPPNRT